MTHAMTDRIEVLETRVAYQEHTIETLSNLVYEQQRALERLDEQHKVMVNKINTLADNDMPTGPEVERPPHY